MSDSRPLFAFAFRSGLGHMLCDFADADAAGDKVDFVWVHLDLSDATAQAWLRRRPWPADVIEMVAAPISVVDSSSHRIWSTDIYATSATSPMPLPCRRVRFVLSPRGHCSSLVDVSRCAQSVRCEAGSKRGRSGPKARSG